MNVCVSIYNPIVNILFIECSSAAKSDARLTREYLQAHTFKQEQMTTLLARGYQLGEKAVWILSIQWR